MGALSWRHQGEMSVSQKEKSETQKHQRLNRYQESTAGLNSEANCYKLGEEYYSNRDIRNSRRRKLWTCWEPATVETRGNKRTGQSQQSREWQNSGVCIGKSTLPRLRNYQGIPEIMFSLHKGAGTDSSSKANSLNLSFAGQLRKSMPLSRCQFLVCTMRRPG